MHSYSLANRGPGAPMNEEGFSFNLAPLIPYSGGGSPPKSMKCSDSCVFGCLGCLVQVPDTV